MTLHLIAVVGPTGSGKTGLAVKLAKKFGGVIISADSRQVYRGLDVGTNKEGEPCQFLGHPGCCLDGVPQLLIDVADPGERFILHDWLTQARDWLKPITQAGKLPIVVGGTGLYVTALLEGYQPGEGRYSKRRSRVDFKSLTLMPRVDRQTLYELSDRRYEKIFDDLVKETTMLLAKGVEANWLISLGLDYRYATLFVLGRRNRKLAIEEFQQASRQYIRRQLTWWRHHGRVEPVDDETAASRLVESFLKN